MLQCRISVRVYDACNISTVMGEKKLAVHMEPLVNIFCF